MTEETVPLYIHEFQLEVTGCFSRLEAGQQAIVQRLDVLNGSVGAHQVRIGDIEKRNATRDASCPLLGELETFGEYDMTDFAPGSWRGRLIDRLKVGGDAVSAPKGKRK